MKNCLALLNLHRQYRPHLLIASIVWSIMSIVLIFRGGFKLWNLNEYFYILLAIALGLGKAKLILYKVATKIVERNFNLPSGSGIHMVFSARTWVLILVMMLAGYCARLLELPVLIHSTVVLAVGSGLLAASFKMWIFIINNSDYTENDKNTTERKT
jgi:hypothetical protein